MWLQRRGTDAGLRSDPSAAAFRRPTTLGTGRYLQDDVRHWHRKFSVWYTTLPDVDRSIFLLQVRSFIYWLDGAFYCTLRFTSQIFVATSHLDRYSLCVVYTVLLGTTLAKQRNINCKAVLDIEAVCMMQTLQTFSQVFFILSYRLLSICWLLQQHAVNLLAYMSWYIITVHVTLVWTCLFLSLATGQ